MSDHRSLPETAPRKGAAIKMLGVAIIFVGMLDTMLSWRGGFRMDGTYALVIAFGFFLYALGVIRSGSRNENDEQQQPHGR